MDKRGLGKQSEDLVCTWLTKHGYQILERNFRTRFGELDAIAKKADELYLIEVRSRHVADSGDEGIPAESISRMKLNRITKCGQFYASKCHCDKLNIVILVIEVYWYNSGRTKINVIPVY